MVKFCVVDNICSFSVFVGEEPRILDEFSLSSQLFQDRVFFSSSSLYSVMLVLESLSFRQHLSYL